MCLNTVLPEDGNKVVSEMLCSYSTQSNGQNLKIRRLILFCFSGVYLIIFFHIDSALVQRHTDENFDGIVTEKINAYFSKGGGGEQPIEVTYVCHT
jgi:hypothetical protein